jgi:plasmid stabilization system protein ParE
VVYKVVVSKRAQNKLLGIIKYLIEEWSEKVALDFKNKVLEKYDHLEKQPNSGLGSEKIKDIRSILVVKQLRLVYRFEKETIKVLNFFDTRQNPKKKKF